MCNGIYFMQIEFANLIIDKLPRELVAHFTISMMGGVLFAYEINLLLERFGQF